MKQRFQEPFCILKLRALLYLEARPWECNWLFWSCPRETPATSVIINCAVTRNMHINFIMKSLSFYTSLYFWSVGEAIFPLGTRKFCCKYTWEWVWKNFVGEGFIGSVTQGCISALIGKLNYGRAYCSPVFGCIPMYCDWPQGKTSWLRMHRDRHQFYLFLVLPSSQFLSWEIY